MKEEGSKLIIEDNQNKLNTTNNNEKKNHPLRKRKKIINKIQSKKERNPGIELLRLLAMYAIIIHHVLLFGNTFNKYKQYKQINLINISTFWHVGCYALISGIVGYKSYKYSNLFYLWTCTVFYSVIIYLYYKKYHPKIWNYNYWKDRTLFEHFFPVIYEKYWYFSKYFGMYLFIPLVNKGLSIVNKKELKIIVISLFVVYVLKNFINRDDPFGFNSGRSVIGLLIYFITGAYFGKYIIIQNENKSIFYYLICLFVYISSTLLCYYFCHFFDRTNTKIKILVNVSYLFENTLSSFAKVLQIISITLIFSQMKYNKIIGKILSNIGHLTFGVYLIHFHPYVKVFEISKIFRNYNQSTPLKTLVYLVYLRSLQIYIVCLIIEYIRYLLFKLLKIREICIFAEKQMNKLF